MDNCTWKVRATTEVLHYCTAALYCISTLAGQCTEIAVMEYRVKADFPKAATTASDSHANNICYFEKLWVVNLQTVLKPNSIVHKT